ncbi:hypothetical protein VTI74DRAFT_6219 [Chaetomium olivicolor]
MTSATLSRISSISTGMLQRTMTVYPALFSPNCQPNARQVRIFSMKVSITRSAPGAIFRSSHSTYAIRVHSPRGW